MLTQPAFGTADAFEILPHPDAGERNPGVRAGAWRWTISSTAMCASARLPSSSRPSMKSRLTTEDAVYDGLQDHPHRARTEPVAVHTDLRRQRPERLPHVARPAAVSCRECRRRAVLRSLRAGAGLFGSFADPQSSRPHRDSDGGPARRLQTAHAEGDAACRRRNVSPPSSISVPHLSHGMPNSLEDATTFRMSLTNGTPIVTFGDYDEFANRTNDLAFIAVNSFASGDSDPGRGGGALLRRARPLCRSRLGFTIIACVMSARLPRSWRCNMSGAAPCRPSISNAPSLRANCSPYYQPVINLRTGKLLGCEVLVRWEKKSGKVVPPGAFIDYAEAHGPRHPDDVQPDAAGSNRTGTSCCREMPDLKISINLFEGHFRDNSIVEDVRRSSAVRRSSSASWSSRSPSGDRFRTTCRRQA